jgi:polyhydroxybutyrate depolymerase
MKNSLLLIAALCFSLLSSFGQARNINVSGLKRKYVLYLPKDYQAARPHALVFNFHGGGMTAVEQMFYTRMNQTADQHRFIVVYPAGLKNDWNVGFDMSYLHGSDDIGFIKSLLDSLKKEFQIDKHAVFATGLSRGGFFCHRLAAEMPADFAAIASVGGPLPDSVRYYHRSAMKVSVMQVLGNADQVVNYDGKSGAYASAEATFNYWSMKNNLVGNNIKTRELNRDKRDETVVQIKEVKGDGAGVSLVTVRNGGHTWPGSDPFNIGYPLGKTSQDIDINELIWQFFLENKK